MRFSPELERHRVTLGEYRSEPGQTFGAFTILGPCGMELLVIATDGLDTGWEHVSVSGRRIPNWEEMMFIKRLFWAPEECVVQYHPPENEYVNCHPRCLHLWRHTTVEFPVPPSILVGPRQ